MSLPRKLARLALGTLNGTLNAVQLAIWIPIGLLLFVGIAGVVFAPALKHLQDYWWVYLLAISALVAAIRFLASRKVPETREPGHRVLPNGSPRTQHAGSQVDATKPREDFSGGRPTSGLPLFRFTEAWLMRNGLYAGREMLKADAVKIAGRSAISYHLREGNFVELNGRIALTAKGHAHFAKRRALL